jgi:hypothetical protein
VHTQKHWDNKIWGICTVPDLISILGEDRDVIGCVELRYGLRVIVICMLVIHFGAEHHRGLNADTGHSDWQWSGKVLESMVNQGVSLRIFGSLVWIDYPWDFFRDRKT